MTSQAECLEALAAGKTLTNGRTFVHLDKYGAQVHTGYKSSHTGDYTFDSPQYWHIFEGPTFRSSNTLFWVSVLLFLSLCVNLFLYTGFDTLSIEHDELQQRHAELYIEYAADHEQLESYQITQQQLEDLGASPEQAHAIIQAASLYDIDPKH